MKSYAKSVLRPAWSRLRLRVEGIVDARLRGTNSRIDELSERIGKADGSALELKNTSDAIAALLLRTDSLERAVHIQAERLVEAGRFMFASDPSLTPSHASTPFMAYANCQASDFYHPRYAALCKLMAARPHFHRKQWEWVYLLHHLTEAGVLRPGSRGLAFGVGTEPLPAVFASLGVDVTATDAPMDVNRAETWHATNQHSGDVTQLLRPDIAPDDLVRAKVRHQACDMNNIDPSLTGYDFNWSSCCFEHLGSIEHGLQFVINAVEKTLKVGGVAVHTTEFNCSSNEETVEDGDTVLFRLRDLESLAERLRDRGHEVQPIVIGPTAHALDFHVDVPPYAQNVHLKLLLAGYVATSVGLVVRRGR